LILVTNRDRRIIVFNKALSTLTGLAKEDVLGQDVLELVAESERLRFSSVVAQTLRGEPASNFETRLIGPSGREIRVTFATSVVPTNHGEVEGVTAIGQDITVIRELEKQVIHAEKLASLGQLAASVVHEINNPMTAVHTYADAMWKRTLGQPTADKSDAEKLKKIVDNSDRVLRFTRDLISYARPSEDKKTEKVDVHKLLELALTFCDHVLSQHGVTVERSFAPVPEISAIHGNLVQVFVNLITNACHAMGPGGVVRLRTEAVDGRVLVRVEDSGTGIDPNVLPRIFEPFFTTKPHGKGTGLGLSIVQGIVEKHGGQIEVQSKLGSGTSFVVKLPV
ncbi:MAG: two-component system sensor histidine kinase NtrB, partial [Myxococcaceae bacterium]